MVRSCLKKGGELLHEKLCRLSVVVIRQSVLNLEAGQRLHQSKLMIKDVTVLHFSRSCALLCNRANEVTSSDVWNDDGCMLLWHRERASVYAISPSIDRHQSFSHFYRNITASKQQFHKSTTLSYSMDSSTTDLVSLALALVLFEQFVYYAVHMWRRLRLLHTAICCLACEMLLTEYIIAQNLWNFRVQC